MNRRKRFRLKINNFSVFPLKSCNKSRIFCVKQHTQFYVYHGQPRWPSGLGIAHDCSLSPTIANDTMRGEEVDSDFGLVIDFPRVPDCLHHLQLEVG